jgi:hypothetical protein
MSQSWEAAPKLLTLLHSPVAVLICCMAANHGGMR